MNIKEMYKTLPVIETQRTLLRTPTLKDTDDIYEYTSNPKVAEYLTWDYHKTKESTINFINHIIKISSEGSCIEWCVEYKENKKVIGMFGFVRHDQQSRYVELGYVLNEKYWNKGIGTEIVKELIKWAFSSDDINKIYATHQDNNNGSGKIMTNNNMKYEGTLKEHFYKNGKYIDLKCYGLLRKEYKISAEQAGGADK